MELKNIDKNNYNKVLTFNHRGVQVPTSLLSIKLIKDGKEITLLDLFNYYESEKEKLIKENEKLKNEIKDMKNQVANALEYLQKEINKKGTI